MNPYVYVNGNPVSWIDPLGLSPINTTPSMTPEPTVSSPNGSVSVPEPEFKPDFIVSPNGTVMPTSKDVNLVDAQQEGGSWFQIHNTHNDMKVNSVPHTHFPTIHLKSIVREIKKTDGADLDKADKLLRDGTMRERIGRKDRGDQ
nr:hypothetical protein [Budvicia aquatica]